MSLKPTAEKPQQTDQDKDSGRRAWDGNPPQVAAARERLLEAAARCIARDGIAAASVAAIATEAGVSRQTVYRYFRSRGELTGGAIAAAADELRAMISTQLRVLSDPADMIVEALVLGLNETLRHPVLRAIADSSHLDGSIASQLTRPAGIAWVRETLGHAIEAARWNEAAAEARLELILRIFLSLIISPSPERNPDELRAFLYRHVIPGLGLATSEEIVNEGGTT